MTRRITAAQLPAALQQRIDEQRAALLDVVHEQALKGLHRVDQAIRETTPHQPVDVGLFKASFKADLDDRGATVGSDMPYAPVIEFGARPFTPPLRPLIEWALRKFRVSVSQSWRVRGRKRGTGLKLQDFRRQEAEATARAVQRAISRRGIRPRRVLQRATEKMRQDLGRALKRLRNAPGFRSP